MAYDEGLAERIRGVVEDDRRVSEKKMFGGVAFLLDGKMFVGIVKDDLMVRVGPERYDEALARAHVRPMDFSGKPMVGFIYVAPDGCDDDDDLERWVRLGAQFVATLPAKPAKASKATKTAKPAKPTKPAKPAKPTKPAKGAKPAKPASRRPPTRKR
jgi:TfoX/Sxy family transcriptional regulator of competence genes